MEVHLINMFMVVIELHLDLVCSAIVLSFITEKILTKLAQFSYHAISKTLVYFCITSYRILSFYLILY